MKKLYCPKCGEYLEAGDGTLKNCMCGWEQPPSTVICPYCHAENFVCIVIENRCCQCNNKLDEE